ncbi:MAG: germination protein YpeB [Firmicutes bacterium]|nr:germination protein YpeB [Bacillota bacterium]
MRNWPIAVLALALVGALAWGYTQHRQRVQLALRAENTYQQAFHRLQQSMASIEEQLAVSLATGSARLLARQMSDLKVFTSGAVEDLAGLPLLNVKLEQTHQFLNRLFDTADRLDLRAERGEAATPEDRRALQELYQQARALNGELNKLATVVAGGRIRWADTERATMLTADGDGRTPILDGFSAIERGLQPPPGEESANAPATAPSDRAVSDLGPRIPPEEAVRIAVRFLDLPPTTQPQPPTLVPGAVPVYLVSYTKTSGVPVTVAVTQEGGHVLEVLDGREVKEVALDREAVLDRARQFLAKNGFDPVVEVDYDEYGDAGGVAVAVFVPVEDGLPIFHQRLKVRVARDNGEILGYDAREHWLRRRPRSPGRPALTEAEVRSRLAPGLTVEEIRLGVTETDQDGEALAYRVLARGPADRYEIYVDARTGEEVRVRRVQPES